MEENNEIIVKVLGTQTPFCVGDSAGPSYLVKYKGTQILLDCGSGSHRFFDFKNMKNLNIFISSLRNDFCSDLDNYLFVADMQIKTGKLEKPPVVYLPTYPMGEYSYRKSIKQQNCYVDKFDITEYNKYQLVDMQIDFCKLAGGLGFENYAIRLKSSNKTVVYSGNLNSDGLLSLTNFAKAADLLICQLSLVNNGDKQVSANQVATMAKNANVKKMIFSNIWDKETENKGFFEMRKIFAVCFAAKEKAEYQV